MTVVCGKQGRGLCKPGDSDREFPFHVCQIRHERDHPHQGYHVCGACKRQFV
jgi:hypothetical protein